MNTVLIIIGVVIVLILIFLNSKFFDRKDKRKEYLQILASFLGTQIEPAEQENSWQIRSNYKGRNFVFEDIEDRLQKSCVYKVRLRVQVASGLKIDFTERDRTTIRAEVQSLSDMKSPWTVGAEKVILPPGLNDFKVFSNDYAKVNKLFSDEKIVRAFKDFKSITPLGNPYLALALMPGWLILSFHPLGELKPCWEDLHNSPSLIGNYLDQLDSLALSIEALEKK